ncbi:protein DETOXIFICATION 19-like [Wolffia australiana]
MLCLEYWAFDIITLLAGLMPDSDTKTSIVAMCVNTVSVSFFITFGFSAVVSTRVANELGAGNVDKAKNAIKVASELAIVLATIVVSVFVPGHKLWARFFSSSPVIITEFGRMVPLLTITMILDTAQGVLSGVARGCGWQRIGACTNLGAFYLIGTLDGSDLRSSVSNLHPHHRTSNQMGECKVVSGKRRIFTYLMRLLMLDPEMIVIFKTRWEGDRDLCQKLAGETTRLDVAGEITTEHQ